MVYSKPKKDWYLFCFWARNLLIVSVKAKTERYQLFWVEKADFSAGFGEILAHPQATHMVLKLNERISSSEKHTGSDEEDSLYPQTEIWL